MYDLTPAGELLHGDGEADYVEARHQSIDNQQIIARTTTALRVAMRPGRCRALLAKPNGRLQDLIKAAKAHIHANGKHPFRVLKLPLSFQKTKLHGVKSSYKVNEIGALTKLFPEWRCTLIQETIY